MAEKNTDKQHSAIVEKKKIFYYNWIVKNIPFFLFIAVLTVFYIANGHYADKIIRKTTATEKHLKDMQYEFKTVKRDVIFLSKESELVKAVEPLGLKELTEPAIKIDADNNK